ncbi:ABZJ_00895 family protein [Acinetobacter radioresistens]|uniref:ABZJ_00895 family protein n=1 Tax=Acinetobacter radioresistens TaxID=40216 RepID=UPI00200567A5|nr:ABZJ_00895 family protein [Acinetobacter radioresistens]MCK4109260.1 hypothetical protein [Acinetobacter radioresistens]
MPSLTRYYLRFFLWCLGLTLVVGVVAALLPAGLGGILTIIPYMAAMIITLYKFLNQQGRAPSQRERKRLTLGFTLIFWGYNLSFLVLGLVWFSRKDLEVWQNFMLYLQHPQFLSLVAIMCLLMAIPLYLLTYWFYGPQAQRMAQHKFGSSD